VPVDVKICGLKDAESISAALDGGAAMVGFVFYHPSPRFISIDHAFDLIKVVPEGVKRVGLVVDADDLWLTKIVNETGIDMLQLHGNESPERVREIHKKFKIPIIKVIPVKDRKDLNHAYRFEEDVEYLLFDARPSKSASRPGGNAKSFDWSLLSGNAFKFPWILAGGLNSNNVSKAVKISGAQVVDVSSGVEDLTGRKNVAKIKNFLATSSKL